MANEQELLRNVIKDTLREAMDRDCTPGETYINLRADQILVKLKALGYEQVWTECPECKGLKEIAEEDYPDGAYYPRTQFITCPTCKGTGKITKYVKWDGEKVANHFALCKGRLSTEEQQHRFADQLYKELTGVNNG